MPYTTDILFTSYSTSDEETSLFCATQSDARAPRNERHGVVRHTSKRRNFVVRSQKFRRKEKNRPFQKKPSTKMAGLEAVIPGQEEGGQNRERGRLSNWGGQGSADRVG